LFAYSANVN